METIEIQLKRILDDYNEETQKIVNAAVDKVSKEAVEKLKASSPKDKGKYAKGWSVKKAKLGLVSGAIVYNRTAPGLTHLLEKGHVIMNQYGEFGRVTGKPHIKQVEEWAITEFEAEVERGLE